MAVTLEPHGQPPRHKVEFAYHPQTNGQTEISNREIKQILEKMVNTNRKDWAIKLDDALWVFGKACHLPVELEHRAYWAVKKLNFDMKAAGKERLLQLHEIEEFRKLKSRWSGPFTVVKVHSYGAIELSCHDGQTFQVNGQRLKHYFGNEVRNMEKVSLIDPA
ncbi:uncharacterized protein [Henckelia pumila]|uniref:uncharacterized protein n=1 Tax=Henckelia pumila TaxID=405737 RepID=UPI003C6E1660